MEEIQAATAARIISAVMFVSTAASVNVDSTLELIIQDIEHQLRVLL